MEYVMVMEKRIRDRLSQGLKKRKEKILFLLFIEALFIEPPLLPGPSVHRMCPQASRDGIC